MSQDLVQISTFPKVQYGSFVWESRSIRGLLSASIRFGTRPINQTNRLWQRDRNGYPLRPSGHYRDVSEPRSDNHVGLVGKVDMWSIGCVLSELFTGKQRFPVFENEEARHLELIRIALSADPMESWLRIVRAYYDQILERKNEFIDRIHVPAMKRLSRSPVAKVKPIEEEIRHEPVFRSFVESLLAYESRTRVSAEQSLKHEFISKRS